MSSWIQESHSANQFIQGLYLQESISTRPFLPTARVQCFSCRQVAHLCQLWHTFYTHMTYSLVFVTFHCQGSSVQVARAAPFYTCLTPHIFSDRVSLVGFLLGVNQISSRYEPFQGSMIIGLFNSWVYLQDTPAWQHAPEYSLIFFLLRIHLISAW